MFQWKKPDNLVSHFLFDKNHIQSKRWANMPSAAKSIFPVIAVHRNERGTAFPSQITIAVMAGVDPKTVRNGLEALDHLPGFSRSSKISGRGHRFYTYNIKNGSAEKNMSFAFFRRVIDGGNWHRCSDSAKAVYPAMRHFSYFDLEEYSAATGDQDLTCYDMPEFIANGYFAKRWFDFCSADIDILAEYSGVSEKSVYSALESLEQNFLIKPIESVNGGEILKVYRLQETYFKPEYMNKITAERYR